jgi:Secretion system C-terminal sorting domain
MKKLLKKLLFSSLFVLISNFTIQAQVNLVPDGSFEDTTIDWQNFSGEGALKDWHQIKKKAINFFGLLGINRLLDTVALKLPNGLLKQFPKNGNNAIFFQNYVDRKTYYVTYIFKSIIKAKLTQKLTAGKTYCATMYVTADEHLDRYYTNGMSMYFDNGQLDTMLTIHKDSSATFSSVTPQVQCSFIINDTLNWMKIQGTFVANGSEEYITIMNPIPDSMLQKQTPIPGDTMCLPSQYVLLDDVSLIPIDLNNWLHDTFCAVGDSVWVGLDWRDYSDGIWYSSNGEMIDTTNGFWYKPTAPVTKFIQGVEVCGIMKYDTMNVYMYPLSTKELKGSNANFEVQLFPNPTHEGVSIKTNLTADGLLNIIIKNSLGQQVLTNKILTIGKVGYQGLSLPTGVYFITISNSNNEQVTQKLIIN